MTNPSASSTLGRFIWYDQMSNDLPGAEKFYASVVGWTIAPNTMNAQRYSLLKAGETMVGGLMPIPEEAAKMGVRPAWMGYIAVDDVKAYADKVKAAGGAIHRPPTEIPNVGTFAIAGDPSGAGFLLFKGNGEAAPAQDPMLPGHMGWHELHGGDPEKSFAFYSGLFGWTKGEAINMGPVGTYQIFTTKGRQGGGMMKMMAEEPAPHWLYYISVPSIDAAAGRVKSAGGKVLHGPVEVPGGAWIINGLDPQGATFALVGPKN
jgi:predicted enzyme related to lactoylglutathione lyase